MLELAKRYPFRTGLLIVSLTCMLVLAISETVRWVQWRSFAHAAKAVTNTSPSGRDYLVTLRFEALGEEHKVRVRVDRAEVQALQAFPAEEAFKYRGWWRERFVTTLVDMQASSGFIDDLATQLDIAARRLRLDDDEYLELLVGAVQSISYAAPENGVRTPLEVVIDGKGICTEKSVLLASLLVHEGYDTVMWSFKSQRHVAVGVATSGPSFRDTGYAFIETTSRALIGQVDRAYLSSGPIHAPPEQIEFGGAKRYQAGFEVTYILNVLDEAQRRSRRSSAYVTYAENAASRRREFQIRAAEHVDATEIVDFIIENLDDRPGVYDVLSAQSSVG